jgi:hypothetical protein
VSLLPWVRLGVEFGSELWREWRRERAKARAAAKQWAETPAPVRGCPRCREIAYSPGQTACAKCSALL